MIIGIDVGGTHTDGVLLEAGQVVKTSKVKTKRDQLAQSVLAALDQLLIGADQQEIERIVFSTTLTTNLIAQGEHPPIGLVVVPGPGLTPEWLRLGTHHWLMQGSIDHRGREVAPLDQGQVTELIKDLANTKVRDVAIVGKFSTRNPMHEESIMAMIKEELPEIDQIQLGSQVAPRLNFPRRVQTTWLNTAVYREYAHFLQSVQEAIRQRGIRANLYLLKADGGTMPLEAGLTNGVETIKSGPAASIMGFLALAAESSDQNGTTLLLDVGGTTTDIALLTGGVPLFEPEGVQIGRYLTAVRGLLSRSIPFGGDSPIVFPDTDKAEPGPNTKVDLNANGDVANTHVDLLGRRVGPAMLFGGDQPTLTDALAILGLVEGSIDPENLQRVREKFPSVAGKTQAETAQLALETFYSKVQQAVAALLTELNSQPVYTIHELLDEKELRPRRVMMIGGPAQGLLPGLAERLQLTPLLPQYHHVANALGAAVARPTLSHTLYADTAQRFYNLSGTKGKERISPRFDLADARRMLLEYTISQYRKMVPDPELAEDHLVQITHEESFNLVRNYSTQGQIIKLEAQVKPGIIPEFLQQTEPSTLETPQKGGM